jgi:uncharacterized membrane protein YphA (DoxX/SURF4 family)
MFNILHSPDIALLIARVAVGFMYASSGFHKLFYRERHCRLVKTLKEDGIPAVRYMEWWVPGNEFVFGVLLCLGIAAEFSAAVLGLISLVALIVDGMPRIKKWSPADPCDWVCCLLYLPETLLGVLCVVVILIGPGSFTV